MTRLGKRILSAFVETTEDQTGQNPFRGHGPDGKGAAASPGQPGQDYGNQDRANRVDSEVLQQDPRFIKYFDRLFGEANIPGPDYYEFSKMIGAMLAVPDEESRFHAAFAGLNAQGLDKEKLLSTAGEYLLLLEADAGRFKNTVEAVLQEKVHAKTSELEEKNGHIRSLSQEINDLQSQVLLLRSGIKDSEEKIAASTGGYTAESGKRKTQIQRDIEKIKQYIH
jgi:hypothetical protein